MDDRIHIIHPHGWMELVLQEFFPCIQHHARIVFPLINRYAEETEKDKLRQYLTQYAKEKKEAMKEMEPDFRRGRRQSGKNYRHAEMLYKRAIRNLQFLED